MTSRSKGTGTTIERAKRLPGPVAAVMSLLIPGLGQAVSGKVRKGMLILASFATILALLWWRVNLIVRPAKPFFEMIAGSFAKAPFFMGLTTLLVVLVWIWSAIDAVNIAGGRKKGGNLIFVPILLLFFAVGWQISEIDPVKMATNFPATLTPLSKILWPWQAAVEYESETISAKTPFLEGGGSNAPAPQAETPGEPYIHVDPPYGKLASQDAKGNMVPGDTVKLTGKNFPKNKELEIWWIDTLGNEFRPRQGGKYASVMTDSEGGFSFDLVLPYRTQLQNTSGEQIHHIEARSVSVGKKAHASEPLMITLSLIVETIFMGMMATIFGILFSIPISFLAARNLMWGSRLSIAVYYITRTILNIIRAIEPLIWALIAVVWVGLGPFAGILALTIHTIASLAKLYSEAIESIDHGQIEAVQATGATKLQTIVYAVIPQMIPPFVSFTIYRWDINVRMSTVIGMVGGGGIGFILVQYIRLLDYRAAGIAVWFIAVTVAVLDYVSAEIRNRFV